MIQDDYTDATEPAFDDQCIDNDFGTDALTGDPEPIPFSGEEFRYYATISRSNFALYMSRYVAKCRLSKRAKTGLNHILASFFDDNVVLSNNADHIIPIYRFDLAMLALKTALTDHDTKSREWTVLTTTLRAQFEFVMSRSTGKDRERLLQHERTTVQKVQQSMSTGDNEQPAKKKLFNL